MTPTEWKEAQLEVPKIGCVNHDCGHCQPKREWVGLTDEEENELWESTDSDWELMKRVEAKLKEKNT